MNKKEDYKQKSQKEHTQQLTTIALRAGLKIAWPIVHPIRSTQFTPRFPHFIFSSSNIDLSSSFFFSTHPFSHEKIK
jgi:hypothetical protein